VAPTLVLLVALVLVACRGHARGEPDRGRPAPATPTARPSGPAMVVAAGDIASCTEAGDEATARLVEELPGTVLTLGDTVYDHGSPREFEQCYQPTWGRFRDRTRPAPGNHDYETEGAAGYFAYFGSRAGRPGEGWHSFDLGQWHVVALNSNCEEIDGCGPGSAQERWLRADLRASRARCTLAYWHHPRFSSGARHGGDRRVAGLWEALAEAGAELVLSGHDHLYERFAPLGPDGRPQPGRGMRQFVVGTGGRSRYQFGEPLPGSEARDNSTFGVLQVVLHPDGYEWRFVPVPGGSFRDAGSDRCR
jgi:3',5'-cyclic AMP phosphodiesterase CpdA